MVVHKKRIIYITAGVITLAVLAAVLVFLLNLQAFKPRIEAAASNALGMDVRIRGRVGLALVPGFGITLKDTAVRNRGADVAVIDKTWIGLKLLPLIRREVRINGVKLIKPVFSITRYKNEIINFEAKGRTLSGTPLAVEKIAVSQGSIVYTDEGSGARIEAGGFDAAIRNLSYNGTGGAGPLRDISFTGDISCKTLSINNFTVTNLVMGAAGEKGMFDIRPVSMEVFGGTGKGSMQVDVTGASPRYRVIAALSRLRVEEMIQAFSPGKAPRKSIEGPADIASDLTAAGQSADDVLRSLSGTLSLKGEDLMLYRMDIDALIKKYERSQNFNLVDAGAYFLAGPFGPVLTKSYNFGSLYEEAQGGKGTIKKLVSVWNVTNGIAEATDVALASEKHRIAMKGELNFINDRFVDVTVAVLDKRGCAVYSQKVQGPFSQPQIGKTSIFKSITGPASNVLEDAWKFIRGGACTVFYSGSVAQPGG
jgi:uncharacterized protein involved in outer membrane biogenesis